MSPPQGGFHPTATYILGDLRCSYCGVVPLQGRPRQLVWQKHNAEKHGVVDTAYRLNPDGSWTPAEPIGWQEEHNWLQRFVFWLRGIKHCCDDERQTDGGAT